MLVGADGAVGAPIEAACVAVAPSFAGSLGAHSTVGSTLCPDVVHERSGVVVVVYRVKGTANLA